MGSVSKKRLRTVLYIGPQHKFAHCLTNALENELDELGVLKKHDFQEVFHDVDDYSDRTALIVVDETLCEQIAKNVDNIRRHFPTQVICVAFNHHEPLNDCTANLVVDGVIRSFLPMNLRLDIWISAVQLMINGGEYMPPEVLAAIGDYAARNQPFEQEHVQGRNRHRNSKSENGARLTAREIDVLALVSKGCQNKIVAAELNLSQHTVKLHMHNIIAKLGVANRTEAAAVYLEQVALSNGGWRDTG